MRNLLILIICVLFVGCTIAPLSKNVTRQTPIEVKNKSRSISVNKLVDGLETNRVVGEAYRGIWCVSNGELRWAGNERIVTDVANLVRNKLDKQGYSLIGKAYSPFNDEYSKQAELLLGGKIADVKANTCHSIKGAKGEVFVSLEWEIYDTKTKSISLSLTSEGYSSSTEFMKLGKDLYDKAFDMAVDNLFAKKEFHSLLTGGQ
jgi:hypothetical protein